MLLRNFTPLEGVRVIYTNDHITRKSLRRSLGITASIRGFNDWAFGPDKSYRVSSETQFCQYESDAGNILKRCLDTGFMPESRQDFKKLVRFYDQLDCRSLPNRRRLFDVAMDMAAEKAPKRQWTRIDFQDIQGMLACSTLSNEYTYKEALSWRWMIVQSPEPVYFIVDQSVAHYHMNIEVVEEDGTCCKEDNGWWFIFPLSPNHIIIAISGGDSTRIVDNALISLRGQSGSYVATDEFNNAILGVLETRIDRYSYSYFPRAGFQVADADKREEDVRDHHLSYKLGSPPRIGYRDEHPGWDYSTAPPYAGGLPPGNKFEFVAPYNSHGEKPYGRTGSATLRLESQGTRYRMMIERGPKG